MALSKQATKSSSAYFAEFAHRKTAERAAPRCTTHSPAGPTLHPARLHALFHSSAKPAARTYKTPCVPAAAHSPANATLSSSTLSPAALTPRSPAVEGELLPSFFLPRPLRAAGCRWKWWHWWQLLRVPAATEERITARLQPAEVGAQMCPARIGPAGADVARLLGALLGALLGDGDALPITGATRGLQGGRGGPGEPTTSMVGWERLEGTGQDKIGWDGMDRAGWDGRTGRRGWDRTR